MKVRLLPLAIAAAVAAPGVAMADTNFYGKINVAYGLSDTDYGYDIYNNGTTDVALEENSADHWDLNSYDSRFGVKGSEKVSDNLSVIYGLEWGVSFDGDSSEMSQRNRFVGLEGGFGTLQAGKFDTPLKSAQGKIDLFGDTTGDLKYVFVGENRKNNIVQYSSPVFSGVQVNVAIMPGEEYENDFNTDANDGPADAISASVTFNMDNLYLAVAHDSEMSSSAYIGVNPTLSLVTETATMDTTRLVGVFNMDAFQIGAMYQMAETSDADVDGDIEQDGFLVSGSFKIDAIVLKAQVGTSTLSDNDANEDLDADLIAVGADYILSKQTNFYAHYTMASYEIDVDGGEEQNFDKFDLGIIHKF